jgi:hypothetical protein
MNISSPIGDRPMSRGPVFPEYADGRHRFVFMLLTIHAGAVFFVWLALFVSKWFPRLPHLTVLREWLYRFF